jgi:zinc protease
MIRRALLRCVALAAMIVGAATSAQAIDIDRVVGATGVAAWLVRDTRLPLVAIDMRFRGGEASAPPGRAGITSLVTALLREGAGDLSGPEFVSELNERSISLSFSLGFDSMSVAIKALNTHRDRAIDLAALALTRPRFDLAAVERVRAARLAGLANDAERPQSIARASFVALAFPGHPYGFDNAATQAGTRATTVDDLRDFVRSRYARDNVSIGIVGDITTEAARDLVDRLVRDLPAHSVPSSTAEILPAITSERVVVVRRPSAQAVMMFGAPGLKRSDPDWFAALIANHVLGGGGLTSRLMNEVREKRGLTYGVYSSLVPYEHAALINGTSSTENARAAQSLEIIRAEWRRMGEQGPSASEIDDAKAFLTGSFGLNLTSSAGVASLLSAIQFEKLGIDYVKHRDALIRSVTPEDIRRVAKRLFAQAGFLAVVVGEPEGITDR